MDVPSDRLDVSDGILLAYEVLSIFEAALENTIQTTSFVLVSLSSISCKSSLE